MIVLHILVPELAHSILFAPFQVHIFSSLISFGMDSRVANGLEMSIQLQFNNDDSAYPSVLWSVFNTILTITHKNYTHIIYLCRYSYSLVSTQVKLRIAAIPKAKGYTNKTT